MKEEYKKYRPVVMWFWNDDITERGVEKQLLAMKEAGVYEFFVAPMSGMIQEYLSDEFFSLVRFTVKKAKELGMRFCIYDDYNWPSGQMGGQIIEYGTDDDAAKSINRSEASPENGIASVKADGALVYAETEKDGGWSDATEKVVCENGFYTLKTDEKTVFYLLKKLQAVLASSIWAKHSFNAPGLADLYRKETADKFIEGTYGRYEKEVGDEMGKTVYASFTDEDYPSSPFEIGEWRLPYTPELPALFEERTGLRFGPSLKYIYGKCESAVARKAKHAYFTVLKELYQKNYLIPLSKRCKKEGVALTGHLQGDGYVTWEITETGSFFEGLSYFDIPGFDWVMPPRDIETPEGVKNVVTSKCRSVQKFFGKERVICETYSGAGFDYPFDEMYRTACYIETLGCNKIQYMGAYFSLDGGRKVLPYGYPPSHNFNNPYYKYYRAFGDMTEFACALSAETVSATRTLMFVPREECISSIDLSVMLIDPAHWLKGNDCSVYHAEGVYEHTAEAFLRNGEPLDVIDESFAGQIAVEKGAAVFKGFRFDRVIFPVMETTSSAVFGLIRNLYENGVEMLFLRTPPRYEAESGEERDVGISFGEGEKKGVFTESRKDNARLICWDAEKTLVPDPKDFEKLYKSLESFRPSLGFSGKGRCYLTERENAEKKVWFLFNAEKDRKEITLSDLPENVAFYDGRGRRVELESRPTLPPYAFYIGVALKNGKTPCGEIEKSFEGEEKRLDLTLIPPENNKFAPARYLFEKGDTQKEIDFKESVFDLTSPGSRDYAASFEFENDYDGRVFLCGEYADLKELSVNGVGVTPKPADGWGAFDFKNEVTSLIKKGKNKVSIKAACPEWTAPHTLPFLFLEGGFYADEKGISGKKLEYAFPQEQNGMPFFTGDAVYTADFRAVKGKRASVRVKTPAPYELIVNGRKVDDVLFSDVETEITDFLKDGENRLEIILTAHYGQLFGARTAFGIEEATLKTE